MHPEIAHIMQSTDTANAIIKLHQKAKEALAKKDVAAAWKILLSAESIM
jgi:hypothetical protein